MGGLVPTTTVSTNSAKGPGFHFTSEVNASGTRSRISTMDRHKTLRHAVMKPSDAPEEMTKTMTANAVDRITKTRINAAGRTTPLLQEWKKAATMAQTTAGINVHQTMHQTTMVTILTCLHKNVLKNINASAQTVASHTLLRANTALAVTEPRKDYEFDSTKKSILRRFSELDI